MFSRLVALSAAALLGILATATEASTPGDEHASVDHNVASTGPAAPVALEATWRHLTALQALADEHGNRAAGSAGYDAALAYVQDHLGAAGIDTFTQEFSYHRWTNTQNHLALTAPEPEVAGSIPVRGAPPTAEEGVSGPLAAPLQGDGCDLSDWMTPSPGFVALVEIWSDECTAADQARVAAEAGAAAAIMFAPVNGIAPIDIDPDQGVIPMINAVGTTMQAWRDRLVVESLDVIVQSATAIERIHTTNLIAELNVHEGDEVAMFGAHLDGVRAGAGMNDNASGVAALLATAVAIAEEEDLPTPPTRLAFWGGEEDGLQGSQAYIDALEADQLSEIAEYSNFDMVGSPNYIINARPGTGDDESGPTSRIRTHFDAVGQAHLSEGPFGGSDFLPFAEHGIPTLDYSSGAGGIKTPDQYELFGGTVGAPHDPNYHQPTDDITNVSVEALGILLPALRELMSSRPPA